MSKPTFSKAMDDHPKLKGRQSKLPDHIQAKIIQAKMKKHASGYAISPSILGKKVN